MAALLKQAEALYDLVVLDGSPVLDLAGSTELAALVHGVALVVDADDARSGELKDALRRLHAGNATIVGAVLATYGSTRHGHHPASIDCYNGHPGGNREGTGG
jgi:Mrp family chromosome partitioning ATPase